MNTHDTELPPLPPLHIAPSVGPVDYPEVAQALMDYARAAIKADRQRRDKALQAENERLRKDVAALVEALSIARDYVFSSLEEKKLALAGYPKMWRCEQDDLAMIDAALAAHQQGGDA